MRRLSAFPRLAALAGALALFAAAPAHAQSSFTANWPLSTSSQYTGTATGNAVAYQEIIGNGAPPMTVFNYTAQGQRLYMGNPGWVAGPEDPAKYAEFNAAATSGQALTVTSVLFEYGASVTANSMKSNVYYSTDGWITRTPLGATPIYPTPGMGIFTASPNVTVPAGSFFSLRIYPYAVTTQLAGSPQFAVHNSVTFSGTTAPASGACVAPPSGMTSWWSGDGTTTDLTTNANTGTLVGGATYGPGKVGQAFSFATTNDYVSVPDAPSLDIGTGDFSIDAWVRTTAPSLMIVDKLVDPSGQLTNAVGYRMYLGGGRLGFVMGDGSTFENIGTSAPVINDGQWHFVTVTVQRGSVTGGKMYVDGVFVRDFFTTMTLGSLANAAPLLLGRQQTAPPVGPSGDLDEVEIFNRALTPAEITALYTAGSAGKCKPSTVGLVCGTKFNDLDGNGVRSGSEPGLPGWIISLSHNPGSGPVTVSTGTDGTGAYCFSNLLARTYTLAETQQTGWSQTAPAAPGTYTVPLAGGQTVLGMAFGNRQAVCTAPPPGMKAWWTRRRHRERPDDERQHRHARRRRHVRPRQGRPGVLIRHGCGLRERAQRPVAQLRHRRLLHRRLGAHHVHRRDDRQQDDRHGGQPDRLLHAHRQRPPQLRLGRRDAAGQRRQHLDRDQRRSVALRGHDGAARVALDAPVVHRRHPVVHDAHVGHEQSHGLALNTAPLLIGRNLLFSNPGFAGQVDELEIFNRVLTGAELAAIYAASTAGKCKTPTTTPGSICGTKFNDLNGDGVRSGSEPGLPGLDDQPDRSGFGPLSRPQRRPASNGGYCFTDLHARHVHARGE